MKFNYSWLLYSIFACFGYLFNDHIEAKSSLAQNCQSLIEHSNITFQKQFDARWQAIFSECPFINDPIESGKRFVQSLKNNEWFQSKYSWASIDTFYLGLSSSAYQIEGGIGDESSWHRFALKKGLTLPGSAIDFWNNYKEMIKEMKEQCHINAFRLSISWERIQKTADSWDQLAVDRYVDIIKTLREYDIEPLVVLHHYTIPTWFEDIGGFEKEENIIHFVEFAKKMYLALYDHVIYWSTFNAIEGYAFKGYFTGDGAPGIQKDMQKTVEVMGNMLKAHVAIYRAIKGVTFESSTGLYQELQQNHPEKQIPCPQIGIQKNIIQLDLAYDTSTHYVCAPMTWQLCKMGNLLQNEGFFNFFTTGHYKIYIPFKVNIDYYDIAAPYTLDWIGINTYSNKKRHLMADVTDQNRMLTTQNKNYRFYPHGLERAIETIHERICMPLSRRNEKLIPIWITENGIAAHSEEQRELFFKQALFVIKTKIGQGYPIIGYTPWASHDNYEWGAPLGTKRYGMFHVDFANDLSRSLKKSAHYFCQFAHTVLNNL